MRLNLVGAGLIAIAIAWIFNIASSNRIRAQFTSPVDAVQVEPDRPPVSNPNTRRN